MRDLTGKKLGDIHAALISTQAVKRFIDEFLPIVEVVHYVDDTIQNTNLAAGPQGNPKTINITHGIADRLISVRCVAVALLVRPTASWPFWVGWMSSRATVSSLVA